MPKKKTKKVYKSNHTYITYRLLIYRNHRTPKQLHLHIFTDVSLSAYGPASCLQTECDERPITVQLIQLKSRLAPTLTQTLLHLEPFGGVLAAQLITKIKTDTPYRDITM